MPDLGGIVGWATFGLGLGIAIITLVLRRLTEFVFPALSKHTPPTQAQQFWERIALPTLPSVFCGLFCYLVPPGDFDYPAIAARSVTARIVYGIVIGWFATWGYNIITFLIYQKWKVASPMSSITPPPNVEAALAVIIPAGPRPVPVAAPTPPSEPPPPAAA